tara:strand:- start:238 stop:480 length:243 start_codon:yes stop_codon:yes gene_type:complete
MSNEDIWHHIQSYSKKYEGKIDKVTKRNVGSYYTHFDLASIHVLTILESIKKILLKMIGWILCRYEIVGVNRPIFISVVI